MPFYSDGRTGPPLDGVIPTLQRTLALEGWWGIYKGAYITAVINVITMSPLLALLSVAGKDLPELPDEGSGRHLKRALAAAGPQSSVGTVLGELAFGLLINIAILPLNILWVRLFVTPFKLPFSPRSVGALVSKSERANPKLLYLAPGLIPAETAAYLIPHATQGAFQLLISGKILGSVLYVLLTAISTLWMVPLYVAITKISAAPNYTPDSGYVPVDDEENGERGVAVEQVVHLSAVFPRASSTEEDVVTLRPPPRYTGIVDALQTIRREEGTMALYRGWEWTCAGLTLAAIVIASLTQLAASLSQTEKSKVV